MVFRFFGVLPGGLFPGESVDFSSAGTISSVNALFFNVGRLAVEGWDFSGGYQWLTDSYGRLDLSTLWTLTTRFDRANVRGAALRDVRGPRARSPGGRRASPRARAPRETSCPRAGRGGAGSGRLRGTWAGTCRLSGLRQSRPGPAPARP